MKTEEGIIYLPDFMVVLIAIQDIPNKSLTDIHYKTKITYSHLHRIKNVLIQKGWISITKDGLKHIPSLTPQGINILNNINILLDSMCITKEQIYEFKQREKKDGTSNKKVEIIKDNNEEVKEDVSNETN